MGVCSQFNNNSQWTGGLRVPVPGPTPPPPVPPVAMPSYDDSKWEVIDAPHDFIIDGEHNASDPASGERPQAAALYPRQRTVYPSCVMHILCQPVPARLGCLSQATWLKPVRHCLLVCLRPQLPSSQFIVVSEALQTPGGVQGAGCVAVSFALRGLYALRQLQIAIPCLFPTCNSFHHQLFSVRSGKAFLLPGTRIFT